MLKVLLEVWTAKGRAAQGYAPQLHLIAGESPSLVAENIFHHAKILHHVCVAGFRKLASCIMLHFPVKIDVQSLQRAQQVTLAQI